MASSPTADRISGMEVPIPGTDRVRWIEVTVPISSPSSSGSTASNPPAVATDVIPRDSAGCNVIAWERKSYLFWRLQKSCTNVIDVLHVSACDEFSGTGLRLNFEQPVFPFAFFCKTGILREEGSGCFFYMLTLSGIAVLLNLSIPYSYVSGSIFPANNLVKFEVQSHAPGGTISAVAATLGCLVIGRCDGSLGCYRLGSVDPSSPDFFYELRDDVGFGRLWNFVSRVKGAGPVKDILISDVCGREMTFALHVSGSLRIWDLFNHHRLLSFDICMHEFPGMLPSRIWVSEATSDELLVSLVVLHQDESVQDIEKLEVYKFNFLSDEKSVLHSEPSQYTVSLEGKLCDLKVNSSNIWILEEVQPMIYELAQYDGNFVRTSSFMIQEKFISDQLFQTCGHVLDNVFSASNAAHAKEHLMKFISSIFLRRVLQSGGLQCSSLHETLLEYGCYLSDNEFQSLSFSDLKKDILALIEKEGATTSSSAAVNFWMKFCARYLYHWSQKNLPCGLFFDPDGHAVGLIRKGSVSVCRNLGNIEEVIYGYTVDFQKACRVQIIPELRGIEFNILLQVIRCFSHVNHHLGEAGAAIYYETLVSTQPVTSDEILTHLMKFLETGLNTSSPSFAKELGQGAYPEKGQLVHKAQRKFSVEMLLSLHLLRSKATSWGKVLDVIENFMKYFEPCGSAEKTEAKQVFNVTTSILVWASSQVARVMFKAVFDTFMFLNYLVNIRGQVSLLQSDAVRIRHKLIPMVQNILMQWLLIDLMGTTPTTPSVVDDFSCQLSSLCIDKSTKLSVHRKLGCAGFTLACLLGFAVVDGDFHGSASLPNPTQLMELLHKSNGDILWPNKRADSIKFSNPVIYLASLLLRHGQFEAAESLLGIAEIYSIDKKASNHSQSDDMDLCALFHLHGFCMLVMARNELNDVSREKKIHGAIRCFFRAASCQASSSVLHVFSLETGFHFSGKCGSTALWRLHYFQWAMQVFEQYCISEGALQFALAALEQVDALANSGEGNDGGELAESPTSIQGRLWANVFEYALDLKSFGDAYCAIISNPDEDSKIICLRRFVIVLCELGSTKVLCDGEIPFVGLVEKVEQELFWKAERSDLSAKPNLYKLLYSFEAYRNNWRKAAAYMYRFSVRLRKEINEEDRSRLTFALQERLNALSSATNALQLVDSPNAWFEYPCEADDEVIPHKRPRNDLVEKYFCDPSSEFSRKQFCIDTEILEKEYVLTLAQYKLHIANNNFMISASQTFVDLVDVLILEKLYDLAFTVILKFWKGSALKRQLEHGIIAIAEQCSPNRMPIPKSGSITNHLMLTYSQDDIIDVGAIDGSIPNPFDGNSHWEALEFYLEMYRKLHPWLPVVAAETLLYTDPKVELPLWLVSMFKGGPAASVGMTGQEADPAALFRLYVNYGRHAEATTLLLQYLERFASLRPVDVINVKKMSAIWFPYTAIQRLWLNLEDMQNAGCSQQHDELKSLLYDALRSHLEQVKLHSDDVLSCVRTHS